MTNLDIHTVDHFGRQWSRFDQRRLDDEEARRIFDNYFTVFPWERLPPDGGVGVDVGCGSGRWAHFVAPRVRWLHLVDASAAALQVARDRLAASPNVEFHVASVDQLPIAPDSLDFAYSLGVLHHLPDTAAAIASVAAVLKPGAPLLLYLYPALEDRPWWFRWLSQAGEALRRRVCRLPNRARFAVSELVAAAVYLPLARMARLLERIGCLPANWPLAFYRHHTFYVMRTDALDRLGTPVVKKFRRDEIVRMLTAAGLEQIKFSPNTMRWCVVAYKPNRPAPKP